MVDRMVDRAGRGVGRASAAGTVALGDNDSGSAPDFTACTMVPTLADGTPLCDTDELRDEPHAYVKLWKHHAAQPQADRINALAGAALALLVVGRVQLEDDLVLVADEMLRVRPVLSNGYAGSILVRGETEGVEARLQRLHVLEGGIEHFAHHVVAHDGEHGLRALRAHSRGGPRGGDLPCRGRARPRR